MRSTTGVAAVVMTVLAGQAAAQVVTPPPAPRVREEYIPPSERPAPEPAPRPAEPVQAPKFDPAAVEFERIYTLAEDGTLVLPEGPAEIAAIKANPLIPEDLWPVIDAMFQDRAAQMDTIVANAPRAAVKFAAGAIDRLEIGNQDSLREAAEISQALAPREGPIQVLASAGVITDEMRDMSSHIWQDLYQTVLKDIQRRAESGEAGASALDLQSRFLMNVSLQEAGAAFDRVARAALALLDSPEAVKALTLDGAEFRAEAGAILGRLSDERLAEVFDSALARLRG